MTSEQQAAYVIAQSVAASIECEGMKAENRVREARVESPAYVEDDFLRLIDRYGLHSNAVLNWFTP
jgi:hypothetical protein